MGLAGAVAAYNSFSSIAELQALRLQTALLIGTRLNNSPLSVHANQSGLLVLSVSKIVVPVVICSNRRS